MTRTELIEKIVNGNDIMFSVSDKHDTILTWMDDGTAISEQFPNDNELLYLNTAEDLVDKFTVDSTLHIVRPRTKQQLNITTLHTSKKSIRLYHYTGYYTTRRLFRLRYCFQDM